MAKKEFTCHGCGASVMKYESQLTNINAVFCTLRCRNSNFSKVVPDWKPSNYLGPKEHKCVGCGSKFFVDRDRPQNRKYCSSSCGYKHIDYSHTLTEETKAKISQKQKEYCAVNGNQFLIGKSQGKHTQETIAAISAGNSGKEPRWKGRTFQYSGINGIFKMRSSYELAYAGWLDTNHIKWQYEPKFKLSDGRMFAPDFKLLDSDTIVEVKGYWTDKGREKWQLFCEQYPEIKKTVLMKHDLRNLGLGVK